LWVVGGWVCLMMDVWLLVWAMREGGERLELLSDMLVKVLGVCLLDDVGSGMVGPVGIVCGVI
jgi:hypothetical protein